MSEVMYNLCELSRPVEGGIQVIQRWLPTQFAVEGKHLRLKNAGEWQARNATCRIAAAWGFDLYYRPSFR